jgi:glycosyltransferase involved in cell wall biosynthesis
MTDSQSSAASTASVLVIDHTALDGETRRKWRELESQGFLVHVLCPDRWVENFRPIRANVDGAPRGGITIGRIGWPGKENRAFYRTGIGTAIARANPRVVIVMAERYSWFTAQCAMVLASRQPRIPFLFYAWDNLSTRKWIPYRPSFVYQLLGRFSGDRAAGAMVANSEAASVLQRCGFAGPIWVVPYCVELSADLQHAHQRENGPLRVGFLGRLIHGKGVDILLEALARVTDRHSVSVLIAGDGPEMLRLRQLGSDLGVEDIVRWEGHLNHGAVSAWLSNLDVIVVPSRTMNGWKEQFGRVLVEAMAVGVVPIGSDSGAIPEVIGDGGVVIPENDPTALAAALAAAAKNPERLKQLAAWARARAQREYSPETFARRVAAVVRAVLAE